MRIKRTLATSVGIVLLASMSVAQTAPDATEQRLKALEEKIIELEGQIRLLKSQSGQPATIPSAEAAASAAQSTQAPQTAPAGGPSPTSESTTQGINLGGARNAGKVLNPDISMIGDFIASAGRNPIRPVPSMQMHESELGVQAIIDPYARGDFFISFGEEGVNLEEGFITFTALPKGFVARVGKMRAAFGKVNTMHNHVLPWIDRPLVTDNLVGGEDGIDDAGFSITHIIPAPKGIFLEATGQVFRGDSPDVFLATNRSDLSTVDHLHGYKDLSESTNLDLGVSYARGHNASFLCTGCPPLPDQFLTNLYGVDVTLRYKPLRRAIYRSFIARSELIWSQRQQPTTVPLFSPQAPGEQRAFGYYASADYQFARRWFAGLRYDHSNRNQNASLTDIGGSAVLTYWPSEFSQIRGQYRVTSYDGALNVSAFPPAAINRTLTNEFRVQVLFSLGAHGAHTF